MKRRPYDRTLRKAAAELTRRRIVEAAVALHSARGASATTHALIARRAGVSIPTVYAYFPTPNDVVPACTGHVFERCPVVLDERLFSGCGDVPSRLRALARALFRLHAYLEPWMRWPQDTAAFPALRGVLARAREDRRRWVREALEPGFRGSPPAELVDLADALLDSPSWRALTSEGRPTGQASELVGAALETLYRGRRRGGESR